VLVPAHRRHLIERANHPASHEPALASAFGSQVAIKLERNPPLIRPFIQQEGTDMFLPAAPVLHEEIHVFRSAGPAFMPAQKRPITVADQLESVCLLDHCVGCFEISDQVDRAVIARCDLATCPPHVQAKMIANHFGLLKVTLGDPGCLGLLPKHFKQANAVHGLVFEDASETFFACELHDLFHAAISSTT